MRLLGFGSDTIALIAAQGWIKRQGALQRREFEWVRRMHVARLMIGVILLVAACARQADSEAIREAIDAMADGAHAHRSADLLDNVSDDFTGNNGELDRGALEERLRGLLLAKSIGVQLGRIEVKMAGERATARFEVRLTDTSGRWIAGRSALIRFETGWRREGSAWRCYNAQWTRADE